MLTNDENQTLQIHCCKKLIENCSIKLRKQIKDDRREIFLEEFFKKKNIFDFHR